MYHQTESQKTYLHSTFPLQNLHTFPGSIVIHFCKTLYKRYCHFHCTHSCSCRFISDCRKLWHRALACPPVT